MRFVVDTVAPPEQVRRALRDFTDRRLQIWNPALDPRTYEVRDQGATWAVARESTPGSPFWVVVRYDWSQPGVVRWTFLETSYGGGGHGVARIVARADGGSRMHVEYDQPGATRQKALLFMAHHGPMGRLIGRMWASALDRYAQGDGDGRQ